MLSGGELFAAFAAATVEDGASAAGFFAGAESVSAGADEAAWLEGAFHLCLLWGIFGWSSRE